MDHAKTLTQLERHEVHDRDFDALSWLGQCVRPIRSVVDVGANVGQSIASVRAVLGPEVEIHSFEANPSLWAQLDEVASKAGGPVHIHRCGLGSSSGSLLLSIPTVGGVAYLEESSVDKAQFDKPWVREKLRERGADLEFRQVTVPIRVGDEFELSPDFIKVDVQGHEAEVLRGLRATIERCRPILMVENSDWQAVTELLQALRYDVFRWADSTMQPFFGACTNAFYLPMELAETNVPESPESGDVGTGSYDEAADMAFHRGEVEHFLKTVRHAGAPEPSRDDVVLDVGGGAGMHSGFLLDHVRRMICMDFADQNARFGGKFVELLAEKFERNGELFDRGRFEFHQGDAMNLMYRDDWFDYIVSFNALEHIPEPGRALDEMLRVLRPGGVMYLTFDPIWTCDTGSHFAHRVPEPWAHLLLDDDAYAAKILAAGGSPSEVEEYRSAMNRVRLEVYREELARLRHKGEFLAEYEWSGCAVPAHADHPNFQACIGAGYTEQELMHRGFAVVIRKPAQRELT